VYTFEQVINLFEYSQIDKVESGSNIENSIRNSIGEFELFLLNIGNNVINVDDSLLTYSNFLFFLTGSDRIPPGGFDKKIEVYFEGSRINVSTCVLVLTLPTATANLEESILVALKFGGGFGDI